MKIVRNSEMQGRKKHECRECLGTGKLSNTGFDCPLCVGNGFYYIEGE